MLQHAAHWDGKQTAHFSVPTVIGGPACEFEVGTLAAVPDATVRVLRIVGEVDLTVQPSLEEFLTACLDAAPRYLLMDLSGVCFCGVRGLSTIRAAADRAAVDGTWFAVSGLARVFDRVAVVVWEPGRPIRYPTTAAAVTAIRAGQ